MAAQQVHHAFVGDGHPELVGLLFESVESFQQIATPTLLRRRNLVLQETELAIQPRDLGPHQPAIERGKKPHDRVDHREKRNEQDEQAADQRSHPERKIVLQQGPSRFVELDGLVAQRQVDALGGREAAGAMKYADAGVDLHRCAQEQILDRGVHVLAHHQAGLRRKQGHVRGRKIFRKITDTPGHRHFVQEWIESDIGVRPREVREADALIGDELLYHRRVPLRDKARHIDLTGEQFIGGCLGRKRQELGHRLVDPIALEQLQQKRTRAAAHRPDRNFAAPQRSGRHAFDVTSVENPDWLVEQRPEGLELRILLFVDRPVLDQCGRHARSRVAQQREILHAAGCFDQPEPFAGARERLLVLLPELPEAAALGTRSQRDLARRHRVEHHDDREQNHAGHDADRQEVPVRLNDASADHTAIV